MMAGAGRPRGPVCWAVLVGLLAFVVWTSAAIAGSAGPETTVAQAAQEEATPPFPGMAPQDPGSGSEDKPVSQQDTAGPVARTIALIIEQQRAWHRELAGTVRALRREASFETGFALILAAFLYGLFHAAGPGHGKAIIGTYLLTQPTALRRGLALSTLSALLQGVVAIVLVGAGFLLFGLVRQDVELSALWFERISFLLVAIIGLALIVRSVRSLRRSFGGGAKPVHHLHDGDHHAHAHVHDHGKEGAHHHHGHAHEHGAECDHAVHVDPAQASDWREGLGIILAIGLRPCSGALLVLFMAFILHLYVAGIVAVVAMSVGTALAVSVLALATVYARGAAGRLAGVIDSTAAARVGSVVALAGGVLVSGLGVTLLIASMESAAPAPF